MYCIISYLNKKRSDFSWEWMKLYFQVCVSLYVYLDIIIKLSSFIGDLKNISYSGINAWYLQSWFSIFTEENGGRLSPIIIDLPSPVLRVNGRSSPPDDDANNGSSSGDDHSSAASVPQRPARRRIGPRVGAFIPPPPANAQKEQRIWQRGPGRKYTIHLRSFLLISF